MIDAVPGRRRNDHYPDPARQPVDAIHIGQPTWFGAVKLLCRAGGSLLMFARMTGSASFAWWQLMSLTAPCTITFPKLREQRETVSFRKSGYINYPGPHSDQWHLRHV
ncbi:MAG: hypothetical protein EOO83_03355 [Oxalobacteraceae bacterium]|nr:MAG: hypothetical protein EOO83_03355 [Oxalobacteraceae bacterium]